jgi:hypothetical protein
VLFGSVGLRRVTCVFDIVHRETTGDTIIDMWYVCKDKIIRGLIL